MAAGTEKGGGLDGGAEPGKGTFSAGASLGEGAEGESQETLRRMLFDATLAIYLRDRPAFPPASRNPTVLMGEISRASEIVHRAVAEALLVVMQSQSMAESVAGFRKAVGDKAAKKADEFLNELFARKQKGAGDGV